LELEGAVEDLLRIERQVGDGAALHLDAAVLDGAGAGVVAARDRYRHLDPNVPPPADGRGRNPSANGRAALGELSRACFLLFRQGSIMLPARAGASARFNAFVAFSAPNRCPLRRKMLRGEQP